MAANFDRFGQTIDPLSPENLRKDNRSQMLADILRNAGGLPEAALTMGTGLADMAGSGLGTLAGMARSKLKGEAVDLEAAAETAPGGKFTYMPRSEGGQEVLRGLETVTAPLEQGMQAVGQKTADVTGSPAAGAAVYTALNVLDPQLLAPGAAKVAALRGAQNVARRGAETAVPMAEALRGIPQGQRGAYTLEDLSAVEGDFGFKSPTLLAFDKLKPQEQGRVTGTQLRSALMREGAKKEELSWMGLDDVLASTEPLSTADVRKIAEANQPEFGFSSARAGDTEASVELDEDAISERVSDLVREDDDLQYPIAVYEGTGRNRTHLENFDSAREAREFINERRESYVDDNLESETQHHLTENLENAFDEAELAEMTDEQKLEWAENEARSSLEESARELEFDTEADYDSDAINYDELHEYWDTQVRNNPADYNVEGGTSQRGAPSYGEYTVAKEGDLPEANYTVSAGRLIAEDRFGRGNREPEFLKPYLHEAEQPELLSSPDQMPLFTNVEGQNILTPRSKAFQIEALRRTAREADPNADKFRAEVGRSHYDEFGPNQMFFTRETDRAAPDWGSVQEGIGRVEGANLKAAGGESELTQRGDTQRPMRVVDESQSDWLQMGRKTGWAEPKTIAKIEGEQADEVGRVNALREQALAELPQALEDSRIKSFIDDTREQVVRMAEMGNARPYYADRMEETLARFIEQNQRNPAAYTPEQRVEAADNFFTTVYQNADAGTPAEAFADEIRRGLRLLPDIDKSPISKITPSAPMRETRQYSQLAMADALRRAVQEGQQYLAWTPGDVHTKRWGTDTFQYAPSADNPRIFRWKSEGGDGSVLRRTPDKTGLEQLQGRADELLNPLEGEMIETIDLDSPDIDKQLFDIVRNNLDYGMHEYPKPDVQRAKRAAQLKKDLEAASKAAQAGDRKAAHYSPRAFGYDMAYEPTAEDIISVLRRAGVKKLPEIKDIPISPKDSARPMRGFEIDPEVAQAAKRGFTLPY